MNKTAIAWTDVTWNVFSGCKKMPTVPGALPVRRLAIDVPTAALARKGSKKKEAAT